MDYSLRSLNPNNFLTNSFQSYQSVDLNSVKGFKTMTNGTIGSISTKAACGLVVLFLSACSSSAPDKVGVTNLVSSTGAKVASLFSNPLETAAPLTAEEKYLREAQSALLRPETTRVGFVRRFVQVYRKDRSLLGNPLMENREAYYQAALRQNFSSDLGRLNMLLDDLRRANARIDQYVVAAFQVTDMEYERLETIETLVYRGWVTSESANILERTISNRDVIARTVDALWGYYQGYAYAAERQRVAVPGDLIHIEVSEQLTRIKESALELEREINNLDNGLRSVVMRYRSTPNKPAAPTETGGPDIQAQPLEPVSVMSLTNSAPN